MREKEKILILFQGEHIAYSPTVIQICDALSEKYDVTITAERPISFNKQELGNRHIIYHRRYQVKGRYFLLAWFHLIAFFNKEAGYFRRNKIAYKEYFFRFLLIKRLLKKNKYKRIISVDILNLLFCSILKVPTDFLSLELCLDEAYLPLIDTSYINCVIIQSKERYEYLLKDKKFKTYYVQNAPAFREIGLKDKRNGLIYAGGAYNLLCFYHCLDYVRKYKDEKLTVQGSVAKPDMDRVIAEYSELLESQRLIINKNYLENDQMVEYISNFEIGFCFYNFDEPLIRANYFNYASAPSGKMFKYLAAGVPVVCSDIIGFKFVNEFQCGVTIGHVREDDIRAAILKIRSNYDFYVKNAIKAARHYDFDAAVAPYLESIDAQTGTKTGLSNEI
jgi:hypothetical protein